MKSSFSIESNYLPHVIFACTRQWQQLKKKKKVKISHKNFSKFNYHKHGEIKKYEE